jgi:hypothetical protein
MSNDREQLLIAVGKVRNKAREIMTLCQSDDMSGASSRLIKEKCEEILSLTNPIIFEDIK